MAKLILKGLIRKRWKEIFSTTNMFYVADKISKCIVKTAEIDTNNSIRSYNLTFGYYEDRAWYRLRGNTIYFNKYFLDWQNPTKNEIVLFELETGLMYIDYYLGLRTWSYEE